MDPMGTFTDSKRDFAAEDDNSDTKGDGDNGEVIKEPRDFAAEDDNSDTRGDGDNGEVIQEPKSSIVESEMSGNENSKEDLQGAGDSNAEFIKLKSEANDLAKAGHLSAALEKYQEALGKAKTTTEYSILKHNKGIIYEAMTDYAIALEHYEAAVQLDPNYYKALKRKSKMLKQLEKYEEARTNMTNVFLIERKLNMGKQEDTQEMWRSILMHIGINKALEIVKEDKPVVPTDAEVVSLLRMFYCDPVSILWKKRPFILNYSPNPNLSGYAAAVDALHKGKYDLIIPCCEVELAKRKSEFREDALMLRGTFRIIWGYAKSSLLDFTEFLASDNAKISHKTRSSVAIKCALNLYYRTVDENQIAMFISLAKELWEFNSDAYYLQAMIRKESHKDYDTAARYLEIAVEYCPVTENDSLYRAELLEVMSLKNNSASNSVLFSDMKFLEKKFDFPDGYYNCYRMLMNKGKTGEAFAMIKKAIAKEPNNVNYLVAKIMDKTVEKTPLNIANQLQDLRKIQEAIGCKHHLISYHIGRLELILGHKDIGWEALEESIDNCRSIFLLTERIMRKLDWEMDQNLDEALQEEKANYAIDSKLFDRSKMYDTKLSPQGATLCTQCGRECPSDEDTDEEDDY